MDPDVAERAKQSIQNHPQKIQQWEGESVPRVSNMEEVRHPQPQRVPFIRVQESNIPIVELGRIQIFRSGFPYV